MAKIRSIIKFSGTLSEITFVNSKTYGTHARAKRGTYTPIVLSEGMQKSGEVQKRVNLMAKIIFDATNLFVPGFKDGKFWSRLISIFRQQHKHGKEYSYADFHLMNMRLDYPGSRLGSLKLVVGDNTRVSLEYRMNGTGEYLVRLLRFASDENLFNAYPAEILVARLSYNDHVNRHSFSFSPLPITANILYAIHCDRLVNGQPSGMLKNQSVQFFSFP
ncbi:MAG: hypothetical protein EOO47_28220 [Flavobacterium sp.]|nr:MAG: hypothetical protein EOO47_28220 [Flavobacterium sp.]